MTPEEKAIELVEKFTNELDYIECSRLSDTAISDSIKDCALICVENEYNALRELLFNLRSCRVIESEKVYLHRLDELIKEEEELKEEINKYESKIYL